MTPDELYGVIAGNIDAVYNDGDEVLDLETAREMTLAAVREEYARP